MGYTFLDFNAAKLHRVCLLGHQEHLGRLTFGEVVDVFGNRMGISMLSIFIPGWPAREVPELVRDGDGARVLAPAEAIPERAINVSPQAIYSIEQVSDDELVPPYEWRRTRKQLYPVHIYSLRKCGLLVPGPWTDEHEAACKFAEEMYEGKPWPVIPDNIWDEEAWAKCLQESFQARHAEARVDEEGMEDPFYDPALADKARQAEADAEDLGMNEVEPEPPTCKFCNVPMDWDSGDSSVGLAGQWYCLNYAIDDTSTHPDICHKCGGIMMRTDNPMWEQYACTICDKKPEVVEAVPLCAGCGNPMEKTDTGYQCVS